MLRLNLFLTTIMIIAGLEACNSPKSKKEGPKKNAADNWGAQEGDDDDDWGGGEERRNEGRRTEKPEERGPKHDPDFKASEADVDKWVQAHRAKQGANSGNYGYVHIPLQMQGNKEQANLARIGIFKALNHVSLAPQAYVGEDISEGRGIAYAIDTTRLWGQQGPEKWGVIASPLPGGTGDDAGGGIIGFFRRNNNGVRVKNGIISVSNMQLQNVDATKSIEGSRFAYNATFPNVYNHLINTPGNAGQLIRRENVNLTPVAFAGHKNAIVNGPRVSSFFQIPDGRYYISTADYFANVEGQDIPYLEGSPVPQMRGNSGIVALPGGRNVVSESYIQGKNGCLQYFIWGAGTQERGRAELVFVADPENHSQTDRGYLVTGRSCISCHINGAQAAPSDMPKYIEEGRIAAEYLNQAKDTWTSNEELNKIYANISKDFRNKCMKPVIDAVSNGDDKFNDQMLTGSTKEPVFFLIRQIEPER